MTESQLIAEIEAVLARHKHPTTQSAPTPPQQIRQVILGTTVQGGPWRDAPTWTTDKEIDEYTQLIGRKPAVANWFAKWSVGTARSLDDIKWHHNWLHQRDITPMLTWEPDTSSALMGEIAAGKHDAYIDAVGRLIAEQGKAVLVRFAHEMNGTWYPWSVSKVGAATYKAAFQRVAGRLAKMAGSDLAQMVWCPNIVYDTQTANVLASSYPGDEFIDYAGLDGYNFARPSKGERWRSFSSIVVPTLDAIRKVTQRPIIVCETGCNKDEGVPWGAGSPPAAGVSRKPAWISNMFDTCKADQRIAGLVYFHYDRTQEEQANFRVDTDPASLAAFKQGATRAEFQGRVA